MKKYISLLLPFALALASCSHEPVEEIITDGLGSIVIASELNADAVITKADVDLTEYTAILTGTEAKTLQCPANGKIAYLKPGLYSLTLTSMPETYAPAFQDPKYSASKSFYVEIEEETLVEMTLTQANAGIYFIYDASLTAAGLENIVPSVISGEGSLVFEGGDREKRGYFSPGAVTVSLKNGGETIQYGGQDATPLTLKAGELREITLEIISSSGAPRLNASMRSVELK